MDEIQVFSKDTYNVLHPPEKMILPSIDRSGDAHSRFGYACIDTDLTWVFVNELPPAAVRAWLEIYKILPTSGVPLGIRVPSVYEPNFHFKEQRWLRLSTMDHEPSLNIEGVHYVQVEQNAPIYERKLGSPPITSRLIRILREETKAMPQNSDKRTTGESILHHAKQGGKLGLAAEITDITVNALVKRLQGLGVPAEVLANERLRAFLAAITPAAAYGLISMLPSKHLPQQQAIQQALGLGIELGAMKATREISGLAREFASELTALAEIGRTLKIEGATDSADENE